ncbi:hypothetical protein D7Y27_01545 [Corallococcus sp. AB004]|nr:hypothetical protein D7Y27_01545 [Corallococcus sp. AB004]
MSWFAAHGARDSTRAARARDTHCLPQTNAPPSNKATPPTSHFRMRTENPSSSTAHGKALCPASICSRHQECVKERPLRSFRSRPVD